MKQIARISAIAYLMIFISGFYANFAVLESLIDFNNPVGTVTNLVNNQTQCAHGLIGFTIMLAFDVLLVWSLFDLTKSINKELSYIASLFRFLHAVFFGIALIKLLKVYLLIIQDKNVMDVQYKVMTLLSQFDLFWTIGLLFFCIHLLYLGYLFLMVKSNPKSVGFLIIIAAFGYFIDGTAKLTLMSYSHYQAYFEALVILTGVVGELSFTIWLLIKGFQKKPFLKTQNIETIQS